LQGGPAAAGVMSSRSVMHLYRVRPTPRRTPWSAVVRSGRERRSAPLRRSPGMEKGGSLLRKATPFRQSWSRT
jgi:hypothetical protein